jgi:hypothetical protein
MLTAVATGWNKCVVAKRAYFEVASVFKLCNYRNICNYSRNLMVTPGTVLI